MQLGDMRWGLSPENTKATIRSPTMGRGSESQPPYYQPWGSAVPSEKPSGLCTPITAF